MVFGRLTGWSFLLLAFLVPMLFDTARSATAADLASAVTASLPPVAATVNAVASCPVWLLFAAIGIGLTLICRSKERCYFRKKSLFE